MEGKRYVNFLAVIGASNTGKTSVVKEMVREFQLNDQSRKQNWGVVVTHDFQNRFQDILRSKDFAIRPTENWEDKIKPLRRSLIVLDDYKQIVPLDRSTPKFKDFLYNCAEHGNTVVFICHHPSQLTKDFTPYINKYILFSINGKFDGDKLNGDSEVFDRMFELHSKEVKDNNEGVYPVFKYRYFDTDKGVEYPINYTVKKRNDEYMPLNDSSKDLILSDL